MDEKIKQKYIEQKKIAEDELKKANSFTNFIPKILIIVDTGVPSDNIIGIISSEVAKYTAINVPKLIILVAYKFVATTENPHCGTVPNKPPINGPNFPDFFIVFFNLLLVLCSTYSIIKYVTNKKGTNFKASTIVSIIISSIFGIIPFQNI